MQQETPSRLGRSSGCGFAARRRRRARRSPRPAGIFAGLEGAWSGEGSAKLSDGSTAPLRCRATYAVSGGGDHLDQTLDCASERQTFAFRIALDQTNGAILGEWRELTQQVQGGVPAPAAAAEFELAARGQGFSAQASVVTARRAPVAGDRRRRRRILLGHDRPAPRPLKRSPISARSPPALTRRRRLSRSAACSP